MRTARQLSPSSILLTFLLLGFFSLAHAATPTHIISGHLQLVWGDGEPGPAGQKTQFRVSLADSAGHQIRLDPASALRAADDLYALNGQLVAVEVDQSIAQAAPGTALISKAIVPMNSASLFGKQATSAVTGAQPWVSILCKFSDDPAEPNPLSYFTAMYANQSKRLDHYWREVSYDKINIVGSAAFGWFTLPHPRSYYVVDNVADLGKLFDDCTSVADPSVDFSPFVGINQMFNDDLDDYAWGGSRNASLDGPYKKWRVTWEPPWSFHNLAPIAHEMGHGFGLPHANNSDGDSDPYDNPWDVMSDAWHNATKDSVYGTLPKHISIYSRDRLGWVDTADKLVIDSFGNWTNIPLDFAEIANVSGVRELELEPPGAPSGHYFTVEARRKSGVYDGALAATAVIVHSVNNRKEPAWSVDKSSPPANVANNRGSLFLVGDSYELESGVHISIVASTPTGFLVDISVSDSIFKDGFGP